MQEAWRQNPGSQLYWDDRKRAFALIREVEKAEEQSEKSENSTDYVSVDPDLYAAVGRNATAMGILIAQGRRDFYATCEREFERELEYEDRPFEYEEDGNSDEEWNEPRNWRKGEKFWENSDKAYVHDYPPSDSFCQVGLYRREKDGEPRWAVSIYHSFYDGCYDDYIGDDYIIIVDSEEEGIKLAGELFTNLQFQHE